MMEEIHETGKKKRRIELSLKNTQKVANGAA